jgi:hypothetical protein
MYQIIGADQKEYGPSSADEIREWIAEGRANGQTLVQAEGSPEWKPLVSFPEFAGALGGAPAPTAVPASPYAPGLPPDLKERDYNVDLGACISRSWALVQKHFWPVVGLSFLNLLISGIINQVVGLASKNSLDALVHGEFSPPAALLVGTTWLISMPISELFMAGLFNYYLKLIRGQPAEIGDIFAGFTIAPGTLVALGLVKGLLTLVGLALCIVPGIYLSVAWIFSTALVIDKRLGFWEAMETSRQVVTRHWFTIFALMIVNGLLAAVGIVACCVGILVTMPIALISLMYAYEDIFSSRGR